MAEILRPRRALPRWWRLRVVGTVDHVAVLDKVRDEAGWSGRYAFMIVMSAGIAMLGLLLSSPAVVIGAMLISPLMGPIIGLGFAVATFDLAEIRRAAVALALGVVLAVGFTALIVALSPLQNVTAEIAARTRPNLFDLMIALFSALAGAYAMIRGLAGTVVGVAIATALMPPLAVVGFGLATANITVFLGALLLFFTNLMTIAAAAAVMARIYGFGAHLSPRQTLVQSVLIVTLLVAFAIPLAVALRQIAWETRTSARAQEAVARAFDPAARISHIAIDFDSDPLRVEATVMTPRYEIEAERNILAELTRINGAPVRLVLEQVRVGSRAQAEAEQLAATQASSVAAADREARRIEGQLALAAGVEPDQVLIDRDHKRARAIAMPLPGAGLADYRALEGRVAAGAEGWRIVLVPPAAPLPEITFTDGVPDPDTLATTIWAARRLGVPIGVTGPPDRVAAVVTALTDAGVQARAAPGEAGDTVTLAWLPPGTTP